MESSTVTTFAPESAYATWSPAEIASANRMEIDFNRRRATTLALADEKRHHTVQGMTDDSLRRLGKHYRRQLEDLDDGELQGGKPRKRLVSARLRDIEREQTLRTALAEGWLAREDGTHCYSAFQGRGGLEAVLHHNATPPSYDLAVTLDWEHWKRGLVHILDWQEAA